MNNIIRYEKSKIKHGADDTRQRLICLIIIIIVTASRRNVCSRGENSSAVLTFSRTKNIYIHDNLKKKIV